MTTKSELWNNPHPLVEDHYHIRELIEAQEKRANERTKWQEQKKSIDSLTKDIASFKEYETLDFFCNHCQLDFIARSRKEVDSWDNIAYYKTKHRCGNWCLRRITDRLRDHYFFQSKKIAYDRVINANEMLQPFQSGFNMLYGKKK